MQLLSSIRYYMAQMIIILVAGKYRLEITVPVGWALDIIYDQ